MKLVRYLTGLYDSYNMSNNLNKQLEVLTLFMKEQNKLIDKLGNKNTKSSNKRKQIISEFNLDYNAFETYSNHVYNNADEEYIGSCNDVLGPDGHNSLYGVLDNIAGNFNNMYSSTRNTYSMIDEPGFYEFDDRAGQMLKRDNNNDRFEYIKNSINQLHSDGKYCPNIDDHQSKNKVIKNLEELERMLHKIHSLSNN